MQTYQLLLMSTAFKKISFEHSSIWKPFDLKEVYKIQLTTLQNFT